MLIHDVNKEHKLIKFFHSNFIQSPSEKNKKNLLFIVEKRIKGTFNVNLIYLIRKIVLYVIIIQGNNHLSQTAMPTIQFSDSNTGSEYQ